MLSLSSLSLSLSAALLTATSLSPLSAVDASGQLSGNAITQFHPVNVIDGRPQSSWCAQPEDGQAELIFQFKQPVAVGSLFVTAASSDEDTSKGNVKAIRYYGAERYVEFPLEHDLDKKLKRGAKTDYHRVAAIAEDPTKPVCLSEVTLYVHGSPFGGLDSARIRPMVAKLLGEWAGGPLGAPDRRMMFSLDGTWKLEYQPTFSGRQRTVIGRWRVRQGKLEMRKASGPWRPVSVARRHIDVDENDLESLTEGDYDIMRLRTKVDPLLAGAFNNARF